MSRGMTREMDHRVRGSETVKTKLKGGVLTAFKNRLCFMRTLLNK